MNSSTPFPRSLSFTISSATVVLAAGLIVIGWASFQNYRAERAAFFSQQAVGQPDIGQKLLRLRLAAVLDPGNAAYRNQLATLYLRSGDSDQAINALGDSVGERLRKAKLQFQHGRYAEALASLAPLRSSQAVVLRSQAYLEQGSEQQAASAVTATQTAAEHRQLALCYLAAGNDNASSQAAVRAASGDTALAGAPSSPLALAQLLYQEGLYRSAERVLDRHSLPDSAAKYQLLSSSLVALQPQTQASLQQAQRAAQKGVTLQPSSRTLRQLLLEIDQKLGDTIGADQQRQLFDELRSGNILA